MQLFSDALIQEMTRLPGARHSYLRQLCAPGAAPVREGITHALNRLPADVAEPLRDRMASLDNRRFFQGFSELTVASLLRDAGWGLDGLSSTGLIRAVRPDGDTINVLTLAFLHAARPQVDEQTVRRLHNALKRVSSRLRFTVFVRKWLPSDFDPEPVRQAVELWLREVEAGRWDGRFAAYEDDAVVLEFGLSGERAAPGASPVVTTIGPFVAGRTVSVVERRVVADLDRYRIGPRGLDPVLVCAVADQPWRMTRGYMREFLYGKPRWTLTGSEAYDAPWEAAISGDREPCLFKDPLYKMVAGVLMLARARGEALVVDGFACSNPLGHYPLLPEELPMRMVAEGRRDGDGLSVLRWYESAAPPFVLGR
ncbi:MAG: hypothetical protein H6739_38325 [Alphaproteobacteria bacterium]|nr:hypothetical protein [Alphaproteobacteria bacterium]